jgi:prevent-host-death family protein
MTTVITATELKATLLSVLDRVSTGEEVHITKRGTVVARLVPAPDARGLRGRLAETARSTGTDDELFSTGQVWQAS